MSRHFNRREMLRIAGGSAAGTTLLGAAGCGGGGTGSEEVTLRLSHQWPKATGPTGDFRALVAQKFADKIQKRTNGRVKIKIYPNASLVDPTEQYKAITQGTLDMSVFPLDYASGQVPQYSITLMPATVKSHAQARNWKTSEIGKRLDQLTQENGVKILTWIWNAGGIGVNSGKPVVSPNDVNQGAVARAAGPWVERMLKSVGYSITSMPSSEIYSAMQTGVLDVAVTSASSFCSYRIYEQTNSYTSPTKNTFWFMFEPLIMGKEQFDRLDPQTQKAVEDVGAELQEFAYQASEADDSECEKTFKKAGVQVEQMGDSAFTEWQQASKPIWDRFSSQVKGGQELVDLALKVPKD